MFVSGNFSVVSRSIASMIRPPSADQIRRYSSLAASNCGFLFCEAKVTFTRGFCAGASPAVRPTVTTINKGIRIVYTGGSVARPLFPLHNPDVCLGARGAVVDRAVVGADREHLVR